MKMDGVKGINWIMYKRYCYREGKIEGNFKTLKEYIEERLKNEFKKTNQT